MSMLRAATETLYRHLLQEFPADRSYTAEAITQTPMPPPVAHFLQQTLERRLAVEAERMRSDWFDYSHPAVRSAWESLLDALSRTTRIPASEWEKTLEQAVRLTLTHLVQPVHTLAAFAFGDQPGPLPVRTVRQRLEYFSAYTYLLEVTSGYFERKQISEIDRGQFTDLLTRIDQRMVAEHGPDDWVQLLEPLFDLMRLASPVRGVEGIPVPLLRTFFEEKEQLETRRRLLFEEQVRNTQALNAEGLRRLLAASPGQYAAQEIKKPAAPAIHPLYQAAPAEKGPEARDQSVPLWKRFHLQAQEEPEQQPDRRPAATDAPAASTETRREPPIEEPSLTVPDRQARERPAPSRYAQDTDIEPGKQPVRTSPEPPVSQAAAEGEPAAESAEEPLPLWKRFAIQNQQIKQVVSSTFRRGSASDFEDMERIVLGEVSSRRRTWFIQHLFEGSEQDYEQVIQQLYNTPSWTQATQIIAREIFQKYHVNIYSEPAVAFTDAVETRYREG